MEPLLICMLACTFFCLEYHTALMWHLWGEKPHAISRSGLIGQLLELTAFLTVTVAGISVFIWSFLQLPWYQPILVLVAIQGFVQKISQTESIEAWITSALVPPVSATGLVALQWLTWFA